MNNNNLNTSKTSETFVEKEFKETDDGRYDKFGFYRLPDKSYWDPDGVYFNKEGFDKHGGYYDENCEYHPGKGWLPELMCYEDEADGQIDKNADLVDDEIGEYGPGLDVLEDDYNENDDLYDNLDDQFYDESNMYKNYHPNKNNQQMSSNNEMSYEEYKRKMINDSKNDSGSKSMVPHNHQQVIKSKQQELAEFEKEYPNLNLKNNIPTNPNIQVFNKIPENLQKKAESSEKSDKDKDQGKRQEKKIEVDSLFD